MNQHFLVQYAQTGSDALREAKRPEHISYRKGLGASLILAGPLLGEGGKAVGSVIILAAADLPRAESMALSDPFVVAGLLQLDSIKPMRIAAIKLPE